MLNEALDQMVAQLHMALNIRVTRDPATVVAPCVFVDFPTINTSTLQAATMQVPVYLVAPAPGDLRASQWLLDNTPKFLAALAVREATPRPLVLAGTEHPAVTATAMLTVRTN